MDNLPDEKQVVFRCQYPNNCACCPPNEAAFIFVQKDAERMQREHKEDLDRMERATEAIEKQDAVIRRMTAWLETNQPDVFQRGLWEAIRG